MPLFRYQASDDKGKPLSGTIEAESYDAAWKLLIDRQLSPTTMTAVQSLAEEVTRRTSLTESDSIEVVERVVELSQAGLPLVAGLRAAAADGCVARVANTLRSIAEHVERGGNLEDALTGRSSGFPNYVHGLVAAAARTGRLGPALDELVHHTSSVHRVWWHLRASLTYPLLVMSLSLVVLVLLFTYVVPEFKTMFHDFELELPTITLAIVHISDGWVNALTGDGLRYTLSLTGGVLTIVVIGRLLLGAARWRRLLGTCPLIGPLWSWTGTSSFARLLAILVEQDVPLPDALEFTAGAVRDSNVRESSLLMAEGIRQGSTLSEQLSGNNRFPESLLPFVECGEENANLADTLYTASEVFLGRLQLRAVLLQTISPPIIFVSIALAVMLCLIGIALPLMTVTAVLY